MSTRRPSSLLSPGYQITKIMIFQFISIVHNNCIFSIKSLLNARASTFAFMSHLWKSLQISKIKPFLNICAYIFQSVKAHSLSMDYKCLRSPQLMSDSLSDELGVARPCESTKLPLISVQHLPHQLQEAA